MYEKTQNGHCVILKCLDMLENSLCLKEICHLFCVFNRIIIRSNEIKEIGERLDQLMSNCTLSTW